jgi:hypothetical protein
MSTLHARLRLLLPTLRQFPELGISRLAQLESLVQLELRDLQALERWIPYGDHLTRAIPPHRIYLICSHNLVLSAWQGITRALILGVPVQVKIASTQQTSIRRFIQVLPPVLRSLVSTTTRHSARSMAAAEAIMAFGSDETIDAVRQQLLPHQKLLSYGHQVSLIWLGKIRKSTPELLSAIAKDICAFDQLGCLSPQAIYLERGSDVTGFCAALAHALAHSPPSHHPPLERLQIAARIGEARARVANATLWTPEDQGSAWTIFQHHTPGFQLSCGYRTIHVYAVTPAQLSQVLFPLRHHLSTVAYHQTIHPRTEQLLLELGVKRLCPIGHSQTPSPLWHHDGRPQLSDLVTWVDKE